jgi:signal transduction histidine kinase
MQFGLAFVLAMAAAGGLLYMVARHELRADVEQSLKREQARLLPPGQPQTMAAVRARILGYVALRVVTDKGHMLYGPDGRAVWGRIEMITPPDGFSEVRFRDGRPDWREGTALGIALPDHTRLVIIDHSEALEDLNSILPAAVLALTLAGCGVGLVATWAFSAVIAQRLARTLATADAIASGDLAQRIPDGGLDGVFAQQVASLNRMIDRMADMVRSQRAFSSHLAHDLRSPLTRLRGLLHDQLAQSDPAGRQMVQRAERECLSIIAIFDALLRLSEIEAGRHPTALVPLDLALMVEDVAETMEPVIADAGSTLVLGALQPVTVYADSGLVQQLLVNLLENIALHTPADTRASVALGCEGDEAVISIADNGPGIAGSESSRLVLPFERGAASERRGSGLGLAIAQAIMRFHHGTLELGDNQPGLIVRLRFPLPV